MHLKHTSKTLPIIGCIALAIHFLFMKYEKYSLQRTLSLSFCVSLPEKKEE